MIRSTSRAAAAAVAILGLAAGATTLATTAASAQTTMPGGQAIPPPPSANDPPPRTVAPAKKTRAKPATAASRESQGSYTDRIDTRPARGDIQLEDDPRVRPTMENGRPGVGMRF